MIVIIIDENDDDYGRPLRWQELCKVSPSSTWTMGCFIQNQDRDRQVALMRALEVVWGYNSNTTPVHPKMPPHQCRVKIF